MLTPSEREVAAKEASLFLSGAWISCVSHEKE